MSIMHKTGIIVSGVILFTFSQIIFGIVFYPIISLEVNYRIKALARTKPEPKILPENGQFKILIPKIDIRSDVIENVDPFNKTAYSKALEAGVAQAKDSALPGEKGNIFIFAHSTDTAFNISAYNAVFYLVNKLIKGDEIFLTYQSKYYKYIVDEIKIAGPKEINYLKSEGSGQTLTLMTCWPPGTTLKRLLVIARLAE